MKKYRRNNFRPISKKAAKSYLKRIVGQPPRRLHSLKIRAAKSLKRIGERPRNKRLHDSNYVRVRERQRFEEEPHEEAGTLLTPEERLEDQRLERQRLKEELLEEERYENLSYEELLEEARKKKRREHFERSGSRTLYGSPQHQGRRRRGYDPMFSDIQYEGNRKYRRNRYYSRNPDGPPNPYEISFVGVDKGNEHIIFAVTPRQRSMLMEDEVDLWDPNIPSMYWEGMLAFYDYPPSSGYPGSIAIDSILVHRRKRGTGTLLWDELIRRYPGYHFPRGRISSAAKGMRASLKRRHGDDYREFDQN